LNRACHAVGLALATYHRIVRPPRRREPRRRVSARRLSDRERSEVLALLDSERFQDQPPREVYAALLSEGRHLCSVRSMYRILSERAPVRDRRNQRQPGKHAVPRLRADAPNQVWTWDITKLATCETSVFLNLYVILDLYSRFVVGWMVASRENSALAKQLFAEAVSSYAIHPGDLIVHMDRGAPMTAHGFADLLSELGVDRSYSRPRVSNDNPYSEAHFRTAKYQPDYPGRFVDVAHARRWFAEFFEWYNEVHHHDGLALFTPRDVFTGKFLAIAEARQVALDQSFQSHPERFVKGRPVVKLPPAEVFINPPELPVPTAEDLLRAPVEALSDLRSAMLSRSIVPVLCLPGAPPPETGTNHVHS